MATPATVDTQQILAEAEKLGQLVAQHPAVARYKEAQKSVAGDAEATRLMQDFAKQLDQLQRQEMSGMPITDAQQMQIQSLQSKIASHLKIKNLNLAEVEFIDLLRKVTQTIQKPLAGGDGAAGGAAGPRLG